jgi:hypothetical protein
MLTWVLVVGFVMVSEEEEEELRERDEETCKIGIVRKWGRLCFCSRRIFGWGNRIFGLGEDSLSHVVVIVVVI